MKRRHEDEAGWVTFTLESSGKDIRFYGGIIGLGAGGGIHGGGLFEGWDGEVCQTLSTNEKQEIAEFMSDQWLLWGMK